MSLLHVGLYIAVTVWLISAIAAVAAKMAGLI